MMKFFITDDEVDSDDHQTSIELSSYSLSDNSGHSNASSQPHPHLQDPDVSTNSSEKQTVLHCSTPLKDHPCIPLEPPATTNHSMDSPPGKLKCSSTSLTNATVITSPHLSRGQCDEVIDLTQSNDDDSDVTYCSAGEDDHIFIDSEASLNPTSCDHCPSASSLLSAVDDQCVILPATPEHSTVRTTSIIMSYQGAL